MKSVAPAASIASPTSLGSAGLDPVMFYSDRDEDDETRRICGQGIITKLLRSKRLTVTMPLAPSYEYLGTKSALNSPKQPQDTLDDNSSSGSSSSEQREDEESVPEFVMQLDEKQEATAVLSVPGKYRPQQYPNHSTSRDFSRLPVIEEQLSTNSEDRSPAHSKMERIVSGEDLSRLLTTSIPESSTLLLQQIESFENTERQNQDTASDSQQQQALNDQTSPIKMELLTAMRVIVLKQQDALKDLSEQNVYLKDKLIASTEEVKNMQRESSEKEAWSIRLNLEKEAFESEARWLREEVKALRREIASMKDDDETLKQQFESLMTQDTKSDTLPLTSSSSSGGFDDGAENFEKTASPNSSDGKTSGQSASPENSKWWNRMANTLQTSEVVLRGCPTPPKPPLCPRSPNSSRSEQVIKQRDAVDDASVGDVSVSSSSATIMMVEESAAVSSIRDDISVSTSAATMKAGSTAETSGRRTPLPPKNYVKEVVSAINAGQKMKQEVDLFKNRLDEIQKRRARRQIARVQQVKTPTVQFKK